MLFQQGSQYLTGTVVMSGTVHAVLPEGAALLGGNRVGMRKCATHSMRGVDTICSPQREDFLPNFWDWYRPVSLCILGTLTLC